MIWLCTLGAVALADSLTGYAEVRADYVHGVQGVPWGLHQRVRPTLELEPRGWLRVVGTVQSAVDGGRDADREAVAVLEDQLPEAVTAACPLPEPEPRIDQVSDVVSVERLFVDVYTQRVDLRIGRQALNWGSALLLNPTDLFAEELLTRPWQERQGVDGVRATVPLGQRHQLVAVAAVQEPSWGELDPIDGRFGLKPTFNVASTDVAPVLSVTTAGDPFVGLDLKGQLGVGWWLEGGVHVNPGDGGPDPALEVSAGVDYSVIVLDGLVLAVQYTYDGTGLADPSDYTLAARGGTMLPECEFAEGALEAPDDPRFTIGRHYGLARAQLSLLDVFRVSATALMNLQDRSTLVVPTATWTPGGAWSVDLSGQIYLGEGELNPHDTPALTTLRLQSDPGQDAGGVILDLQGLVPAWSAAAYVRYAF